HADMLAIIDQFPGRWVGEGTGAAAEPWARFEQGEAEVSARECHGGSEPCEAAADDDNVRRERFAGVGHDGRDPTRPGLCDLERARSERNAIAAFCHGRSETRVESTS